MHNYNKYLKSAGTILLLITIPGITFAASLFGMDNLANLTEKLSFTPPAEDISVIYLAKIFGNVPGVPQLSSSSTTILSPMFRIFNVGILALSGIFLSYITFKVITETTMDGGAMGKSSTLWTAIRVTLSTSLLIPQTNGYSLVNGLIMWIVIQSIGLADRTWDSAINYLKQGAPALAQPVTTEVDYSLINYLFGSSNLKANNAGSSDILSSLLCSYVVKDALTQYQINHAKTNPKIKQTTISEYKIYQNYNPPTQPVYPGYSGGYYYFPYIDGEDINQKENGGIKPFGKYGIPLTQPLMGICGIIGYGFTKPSGYDNTIYQNYLAAKEAGIEIMLAVLDPLAQQLAQQIKINNNKRKLDPATYILYTNAKGEGQYFYTNIDNPYLSLRSDGYLTDLKSIPPNINWPQGSQEMLNAAASYQLAVANARRVKAAKTAEQNHATFAAAKKRGWALAGSYYSLLAGVQNSMEQDAHYYRLKTYMPAGKLLSPACDNATNTRYTVTIAPYAFSLPFFPVDQGDSSPVQQALSFLDPANSISNLQKDLAWVFFSYPYAKLLGQVLFTQSQEEYEKEYKAISTTLTNSSQSLASSAAAKYYNPNFDCKTDINKREVGGAVLLSIPVLSGFSIALLTSIPMDYLKCDVNDIITGDSGWTNIMIYDQIKMGNDAPIPVTDPISKLQNLGNTMIAKSIDYLNQIRHFLVATTVPMAVNNAIMTGLSWGVAAGTFWGTTTGMQNAAQAAVSAAGALNEIIRTILYINMPIGIAVIVPIFVTGMTLSLYVPLIPYLLFLFGVISWFISVIVLMAAAPIICFLMIWSSSSQENPLLSREAEQFVMQIIAVFFRPTLMIMGLVAGVLLAHIGVDLLNQGFLTVFNLANIEKNLGGNTLLVTQLGFIVIYTFTMVSIINLSFSTIYLLYSETLRIAGIQVAASGLEEKYASEVKAGSTQISEAGAAGAKEQAISLKGASANFKEIRPKDDSKEGAGASGENEDKNK